MAGKLTYVGAAYALDAALGRAAGPGVRNLYLALLTGPAAQSTVPSGLAEYITAGYSRQLCALGVPAGTPRLTGNTVALSFGPLTAADGSVMVDYWALVSASAGTGGDVVAFGDFPIPRTPTLSQTLTVAIGAVTIALD
jgi:hypothetical protein